MADITAVKVIHLSGTSQSLHPPPETLSIHFLPALRWGLLRYKTLSHKYKDQMWKSASMVLYVTLHKLTTNTLKVTPEELLKVYLNRTKLIKWYINASYSFFPTVKSPHHQAWEKTQIIKKRQKTCSV